MNSVSRALVTSSAAGWRELPPEPVLNRDALPSLSLVASAEHPLVLDVQHATTRFGGRDVGWSERSSKAGMTEDGSVSYRARFPVAAMAHSRLSMCGSRKPLDRTRQPAWTVPPRRYCRSAKATASGGSASHSPKAQAGGRPCWTCNTRCPVRAMCWAKRCISRRDWLPRRTPARLGGSSPNRRISAPLTLHQSE